MSGLSVPSEQGAASAPPANKGPWPTVLAAGVPTLPDFVRLTPWDFEAVVRVTTDGQRISTSEWVSGSQALARAADDIRTWRLAPHSATTFDVAYRVTHVPAACTPRDPHVIARLPRAIEVSIQGWLICDGTVISNDGSPIQLSRVWGVVSNDLPSGVPIAGAHMVLESKSGQFDATQRSDKSGHFEFQGVPTGHYVLEVTAAGHESMTWRIDVSDEVPRLKRADLQLRVDSYVPQPSARVSSGDIPTYPLAARKRGLEGTVRLRATPAASSAEPIRVDVIEGSPELSAAAIENLMDLACQIREPDRSPRRNIHIFTVARRLSG